MEAPTSRYAITAINIPRDALHLLRRVAEERAARRGGRASVSAVLAALVAGSWEELRQEAGLK